MLFDIGIRCDFAATRAFKNGTASYFERFIFFRTFAVLYLKMDAGSLCDGDVYKRQVFAGYPMQTVIRFSRFDEGSEIRLTHS